MLTVNCRETVVSFPSPVGRYRGDPAIHGALSERAQVGSSVYYRAATEPLLPSRPHRGPRVPSGLAATDFSANRPVSRFKPNPSKMSERHSVIRNFMPPGAMFVGAAAAARGEVATATAAGLVAAPVAQWSSFSTRTGETLTQPTTVSLTGPRQPQPPNTIAQQQLRESTHSDTAEYLQQNSTTKHHREIRMVWPADAALYDWSHDSQLWDGQPIPIDDLDHVFDPLNDYSIPQPQPLPHFPPQQQQQQYPTPEQDQVWSDQERATMDRLIDDAIGENVDFEGFDLDELDGLLAGAEEEEQRAEEEPLAEFFPMLPRTSTASSSMMAPLHGDLAASPSTTPPMTYHDMGAAMYHQHQSTTTTSMAYGSEMCGTEEDLFDEKKSWLRMGAPDGRIDHSPTFMDTGCDINLYLKDWYDEPSTSRSSPDYDAQFLQQQQQQYHQPAAAVASSTTTTTTTRRAAVRYTPYARATPAPAKRAPVFRPEGFGTPAIGENVDEYRKRRDKNNVSSARSRAKKAETLKEMKAEAVQLEKKNIELKAVMDSLEREVSYYKELMMTALSK